MAKYEKALTENKKVLRFIDESAALCNPDRIVWIDGSKEQRDELRAEACATGELIKLNEDLLPECYLHRTAVNDVARVERRTPAPSTTGWIPKRHTRWRRASSRIP